jgi:hypothetical protein
LTSSSNDNIFQNTIYNSSSAGIEVYGSASTGLTVENNILMNNSSAEIETNSGAPRIVSNYNDVYHAGGGAFMSLQGVPDSWANWITNSGQDENSVNANPELTNASSNNFTLQSTSPAIDAGANLGSAYELGLDPASTWPSNIITDNQNSFGAGWDIGGYVYTQSTAPTVSVSAPSSPGTVTVTASASAMAPASIASVQFYLDGSTLGSALTTAPYSTSWNTALLSNGSHTLSALATDNYGNTATAPSVTFTVQHGGGGMIVGSGPTAPSAAGLSD